MQRIQFDPKYPRAYLVNYYLTGYAKPGESEVIFVEFTSTQNSPVGRLLGHLYYNDNSSLLSLCFEREERHGYPHNGGYHTLTVKSNKDNVLVFLDLIEETILPRFKFKENLKDEEKEFKGEIIDFLNNLRTAILAKDTKTRVLPHNTDLKCNKPTGIYI